jgi:hypothetical protein
VSSRSQGPFALDGETYPSPIKEAILMVKRLLGVAAISATTAALIIPSVAGAGIKAGELSFQRTFPVASKLCANVAAGKNKHLQKVATQVLADCETLKTEFATAQTTVVTTRTTLKAQIAADHAAIKAACPGGDKDVHPACVSTRHSEHLAIVALRSQLIAAIHTYYKTVEADRRGFWSEIKALRPARHLSPDKPIKVRDF